MSAVIVADQLTKWYGPRLAVDCVSLEVEAGEIMGLLGPNGSGKTTILRILAGYLRPSGGVARIAGLDVVEDAPLYAWMGVSEFLQFMARLKGLAGAAAGRAVDAAISRMALGDVRRLLIAKLSRGYRQRVAIAQALLGNPDLLILDEPTNGLDPRQIIEMRGHIRSLAPDRTVLVTSHILGEIERVADRAAILLGGKLLGVHRLAEADRGRRLRLRIRGDADAVSACLLRVAGVREVTAESARGAEVAAWLVDVDSPAVAERLAAAVVTAGFGLCDMGPAPVDLEQLFLGVTSVGEAAA